MSADSPPEGRETHSLFCPYDSWSCALPCRYWGKPEHNVLILNGASRETKRIRVEAEEGWGEV